MKSSFVMKIITAAGILAVLFYFGYSVLDYLADPVITAAAYAYRSEEAVTVSGYVIRDEEVLTGGGGLLSLTREEGERVSAGGSVAIRYASQEALDRAQTLRELTGQLEQLRFAYTVSSGSQEALRLDSDIMEDLFALRAGTARGDLGEVRSRSQSLQTMVLKRAYTYSGAGEEQMTARIAALEEQIAQLSAAGQGGRSVVTTQRPGTFSALTDGYEEVLTPDILEDLTLSDLRSLSAGEVPADAVGRMIYGSVWYYAAAVDAGAAAELTAGASVGVRFMSGLDREIEMTVERVGGEEGDERLVVLSCSEYLPLVTLLRHQNAQLIFRSYSGIRVPTGAVRVATESVDAGDGETTEISSTSVYCRMGRQALLKPVKVLYQGEDYYLVEPDLDSLQGLSATSRERRILRGGDEVIVSASGLYDGKVIGE